jgi:malate/lactate dehydrogenase
MEGVEAVISVGLTKEEEEAFEKSATLLKESLAGLQLPA